MRKMAVVDVIGTVNSERSASQSVSPCELRHYLDV